MVLWYFWLCLQKAWHGLPKSPIVKNVSYADKRSEVNHFGTTTGFIILVSKNKGMTNASYQFHSVDTPFTLQRVFLSFSKLSLATVLKKEEDKYLLIISSSNGIYIYPLLPILRPHWNTYAISFSKVLSWGQRIGNRCSSHYFVW